MIPKILVVDDEPLVGSNIKRYLEPRGFQVLIARDGSTGLAMAQETKPDLVVTDIDMPDMDGFKLCRLLKKNTTVPVVIISGKAIDDRSVVSGLDDGADDYILKPLSLPVLLSRVKAVLRRYQGGHAESGVVKRGEIEIDPSRRSVKIGKQAVELTRKEFDLLLVLLGGDGRVLSPQQLLEQVWGYDLTLYNNPHTVEVHVSNLRKKLGKEVGKRLQRITGVGYKFE